MAKRQTRRSISIRGLLYQRLSKYATKNNRSRSEIVENLITEFLDDEGQPVETVLMARKPKPKEPVPQEATSPAYFTF